LRFYAELRDFLPKYLRSGTVTRGFDVPGSVKDMIETCGVPHTEVDLIIANGHSIDFSHLVNDGDRISVFPLFASIDITPIVNVRPEPLPTIQFVADVHLGRLARYLRLLGFDTLYERDWDDPELVRISTAAQRVLLTRDVGLLKHRSITHGCYIRATDPREQVTEVVRRFRLAQQLTPFTRCMACNGALVHVAATEVADRLPLETRRNVDTFQVCSSCDKVYWKGAHHRELRRIVATARQVDQKSK
jgi:hypothetical protein